MIDSSSEKRIALPPPEAADITSSSRRNSLATSDSDVVLLDIEHNLEKLQKIGSKMVREKHVLYYEVLQTRHEKLELQQTNDRLGRKLKNLSDENQELKQTIARRQDDQVSNENRRLQQTINRQGQKLKNLAAANRELHQAIARQGQVTKEMFDTLIGMMAENMR